MMWRNVKLKDLCSKIGSGATPKGGKEAYHEEGISLIRSQNVLDFTFSKDGLAFIDEAQAKQLSNAEIQQEDILLNITGDSVARVCQVPADILPARVNQHVAIIRPLKDVLNPEYLKYYLLNPPFKNYMLGLASSGATRSALTKVMIEEFDIALPDLPTQTRIAEILSSLDDKIELNRRMNQTLEAIAQTLFKEWFVNFNFPDENGQPYRDSGGKLVDSELGPIPEGWRVGKIGDVCDNVRNSVNPATLPPQTPYIGLEHINKKNLGINTWGTASEIDSQKSLFKRYDILFGKLRPYFHKVAFAPTNGICSTDILVIKPKKTDYYSFCLNHLFSNEMISYVSLIADGTRMPRVDWKSIASYDIVLPSETILQDFQQSVMSFYEKILVHIYETASLIQLAYSPNSCVANC